jgi:hypothetical protein
MASGGLDQRRWTITTSTFPSSGRSQCVNVLLGRSGVLS